MARREPLFGQFGEQRVVQKTPLIERPANFPLSALRDITDVAGSASITSGAGEYRLQLTANGTDAATLSSAERGRYNPGYAAEAGTGIRIPTLPTGSQEARWGYFDDNNGVYFGVDATGVYVARLSGGTETKTYQSNWNINKLDGTGERLLLDLSDGLIFQIVFTWYGYGQIDYEVVTASRTGEQQTFTVHREKVTGSVSTQSPNLPVRVKAENGGTATAFDVYVGGRQFSIVGRYTPNERRTSVRRLGQTGIGTSATPILSVQRKSTFLDVPMRLQGIDLITTGDAFLEVYLNTTLSGTPAFAAPTGIGAGETALEVDTAATGFSGGTLIYAALVDASGAGGNASGDGGATGLSIGIPERQIVTLAVRALAATVDVSAVMRMLEDW